MNAKRLGVGGIGVHEHDGLIYLQIWEEDRLPASADPERYALSPGEALELVSKLAPQIKAALMSRLGERRR